MGSGGWFIYTTTINDVMIIFPTTTNDVMIIYPTTTNDVMIVVHVIVLTKINSPDESGGSKLNHIRRF